MTSSWNGYLVEIFKDDLSPIANQALSLFVDFAVPHVVRNIVHDPEARREFKLFKLTVVPAFVIGGHIIEGYNPKEIGEVVEKYYGIKIPDERLIVDIRKPWVFDDPKKMISLPTNWRGL
ncbi:glutaredoxin family protein [Paenibacillus planticolens]|uniref:Thioredoxin-like fold domain-containing protein n=1 Tax=Paenibacillus planticolens TaxID=2654976 RepID=A0ABX1ZJ39_9BACL|nr:hypothetical protein [Paenibacillus planticolens]NOU99845.1 hypothetical protein [Paenibacillus planticolens]